MLGRESTDFVEDHVSSRLTQLIDQASIGNLFQQSLDAIGIPANAAAGLQ